eukprot:TRINITY_DN5783_c0_g1_i1.p1 TRINITY_DN5783_c0_g1~~TRINITY_DN5783_c0_g1_i1.p1  ORF type:complete len:186 (+),score=36.79 TRINITY_DN5783_c0_g1_i1:34-591(+)
MTLLFVADTSQTGYSNNFIFGESELKGNGVTSGKLVHSDGTVRLTDDKTGEVHGEVYSITDDLLKTLDKMEGVEQGEGPVVTRNKIDVKLVSEIEGVESKNVKAEAFISKDLSTEWEVIPSGRAQDEVAPDGDTPSDGDNDSDESECYKEKGNTHPQCEITGVSGFLNLLSESDGPEPAAKKQKQ